MNKKTIAMPDGRYLIYFTFDDEPKRTPSLPPEGAPAADVPEETKDV